MTNARMFIWVALIIIIIACIFGCCCSNNKAAENIRTETTIVPSVAPTSTATAPSISNINVVINSNEADEAQISWYTDTPTMGVVVYGTTSNYGAERTTSFDYSIYHSVFLSGLSPGTTYHYRIQAIDINKGLSFSRDQTFVTPYQTSYSDCYCGYNHYNCYYGSCGSYYNYRTHDRYYNDVASYPIPDYRHDSPQYNPPHYNPPQHDPPPSGPIKEAPTSPPPPSHPVKK